MLTNSFVLLDGVGLQKERLLWQRGISSWNSFLGAPSVPGFSATRKVEVDQELTRLKEALWNEDYSSIVRRMPKGEQWRLFDLLKDEACYIDIETTGYYGDITVLGMYDGSQSHFLIKNQSLDRSRFLDIIGRYKMLVSFNGSSFDIPIIERYFQVRLPHVHVDLRHVCARLGYTGGLKRIERELGIVRSDEAQGIGGADAIHLWNQWVVTRDPKYLRTLVAYNEEDIVNLEPLARRFVKELWAKTFTVSS